MISIYDRAGMALVPTLDLDPRLHVLLAARIGALDDDLIDLTHYLIIEPGDTEADIELEVGFSPLTSPIDGTRYGEAGFQPFWAFLQDHGGWYELVHTVGDSGFAYVIIIYDDPGTDPYLSALCREYAENSK